MKRYIYLDHNATTRPRPEVVEAMLPHLRGHYGNASSIYQLGQEERKAIDIAREQLAKLIGAKNPDDIVFTGGGSESINWAIKGVAFAHRAKGRHIVTTTIEHSAVMKSCKYLESMGWHVTYVGVDWHGHVNPAHIREAITPETALVSVMHANNEIGTIEPVLEIAAVCREKSVPLHVDALQTVGKIPVSVETLGCDLLSIGAHKFYGPKGVGALYIRPGLKLQALIHGGSHERNRRAGTENVAGIAGMGMAAELALKEMKHDEKHVRQLRDKLEKGILQHIECSRMNGDPEHRMFNTSNISIEAVEGEGLIIGLDMQGICVSSGSACSSGQTEPSHVLKAIGIPIELAKGSVRFSLGRENTDEEIEKVLEVFPKVVERLRGLSPLWGDYKKGLRKSVIAGQVAL
jgi:cysteine desulfurase